MKIIKKDSKKGKYYLRVFADSMVGGLIPCLSYVYMRYSKAKFYAYNDCIVFAHSIANKFNYNIECGNNWKVDDWGIIAHTSQLFTFGAILHKYNETGALLDTMHIVITKENVYII